MNEFLLLPEDRRRTICEQAQDSLGLPPATIEKDFWVCWTLEKLFNLPEWGPRLTFKGGTALAKGWALIERFSEDVDVVIDRDALGFGGEDAPDRAPSSTQKDKRLHALKGASQDCVNNTLQPLLRGTISEDMPANLTWDLNPDPDDPDNQTLLMAYPTAFAGQTIYVQQVVRLELGARSDVDPTLNVEIKPCLADAFPDLFAQKDFSVRAVSPKRTFWEKAMLLHEETFRPAEKARKARMARHYYDLYRLIDAGIGNEAADDLELFKRIAAHRQIYFRYTWVDYDTLRPGQLKLVPPDDQIAAWESDYAAMKGEMFFGDVPEFDDLMQTARTFQDDFNRRA